MVYHHDRRQEHREHGLEKGAHQETDPAPKAPGPGQGLGQPQDLGYEEDGGRDREKGQPLWWERDPQLNRCPPGAGEEDVHRTGQQDQEPQERGHVPHGPQQEVEPVQEVQARPTEEPEVLDAPLGPAPVPAGVVHQVPGKLLEAAGCGGVEEDLPAGPSK